MCDYEQEIYEMTKKVQDGICPECNYPLDYESGCNICHNCGWSMCS